jgi:hypothetical protein
MEPAGGACRHPIPEGAMNKNNDRDEFFDSLKLFEKEQDRFRKGILQPEDDVDYLIEKWFSNATLPDA